MLRKCIIFFLLACCLQSYSQDVRFSYQSKIGAGNVDTVLVWARSNTTTSISLGAVNLSWVFSSSCLTFVPGNSPTPNSYWSLFRNTWGPLLDFDQLQNITVTWNGNNYDRRVQYGNAMAFFPIPLVLPPNTQAPTLVMKLWFTGACASQVYMEDEGENGLNQIADPNGNLLSYIIENLLSQPLEGIWSSVDIQSTQPESALLSWVPEADMIAGSFSVERSASPNFSEMETLGTVPNQVETKSTHTYMDKNPLAGLSYYRVRYDDVSGQEEVSRVVSLFLETAELKDPIRIIPNPSNGHFKLNFLASSEPVNAQLWDMQGRLVWEQTHLFQGPIPILASFLPGGTYQLMITQPDGQQWHKKVMIK